MTWFFAGMAAGVTLTILCMWLVLRFRQPILEFLATILTDCDGCICGDDSEHSTACMKVRFVERARRRREPRAPQIANFNSRQAMAKKPS